MSKKHDENKDIRLISRIAKLDYRNRVFSENELFENNPSKPLDWNKIYPGWNSTRHKEIARQAARESIVMLENSLLLKRNAALLLFTKDSPQKHSWFVFPCPASPKRGKRVLSPEINSLKNEDSTFLSTNNSLLYFFSLYILAKKDLVSPITNFNISSQFFSLLMSKDGTKRLNNSSKSSL